MFEMELINTDQQLLQRKRGGIKGDGKLVNQLKDFFFHFSATDQHLRGEIHALYWHLDLTCFSAACSYGVHTTRL